MVLEPGAGVLRRHVLAAVRTAGPPAALAAACGLLLLSALGLGGLWTHRPLHAASAALVGAALMATGVHWARQPRGRLAGACTALMGACWPMCSWGVGQGGAWPFTSWVVSGIAWALLITALFHYPAVAPRSGRVRRRLGCGRVLMGPANVVDSLSAMLEGVV